MKTVKFTFVVLAAALFAVGMGTTAYAFHSGGVAECEGCHSMHSPVSTDQLLVAETKSAACLTCHQGATDTGPSSYHVSTVAGTVSTLTPPKQRTPGGDFGWLNMNYTWTGGSEPGPSHGHNIVAPTYGYNVDPDHAVAPGGTFLSSNLHCSSCHDPHGQARRLADGSIVKTGAPIIGSGSYNNSAVPGTGQAVGVYRILASRTDYGFGPSTGFNGAPAAVAPSTYNRTEAVSSTRVAYGISAGTGHQEWGAWCGTCHGDMIPGIGSHRHPVDAALPAANITIYGNYVKSGDQSGTFTSTPGPFTSLVPFVEAQDYGVLRTHAVNTGAANLAAPVTGDKVTCLSCHRAHASGNLHALRWNPGYEFITKAGEYVATDNPDYVNWGTRAHIQAMGRTIASYTASMYDRPASQFATYQRSLCNKCHGWD